MCLQGFNDGLEELCKIQKVWAIPDKEQRDAIRQAQKKVVSEAYRAFLSRWERPSMPPADTASSFPKCFAFCWCVSPCLPLTGTPTFHSPKIPRSTTSTGQIRWRRWSRSCLTLQPEAPPLPAASTRPSRPRRVLLSPVSLSSGSLIRSFFCIKILFMY